MSALVYRPPVEVADHTDPCWIMWYVAMQRYREEEPALSIAAFRASAAFAHDHTGGATDGGVLTNDEHDGFIDIALSATPATPAANHMRLYVEDAAGVARLRALHSTGGNLAFFRDGAVRVKNASGGTINKGEVVYVTGATGNFPTVAKAKADSSATMPALGIMLGNTTNNSFGTMQFSGEIAGLDTSAFGEGAIIYVSSTTAGAFTATEPQHPFLSQTLGVVTKSNAGDGRLQVAISQAHEGDEFGTIRNDWHVGDAVAGAKRVIFHAAVKGNLSWAPTTSDKTVTIPDETGTVELTSHKDAASGYVGLNAASRTTKGVITTDDLIVDLATKGLVLKDTQGPPHYWRVTVSTLGVLVTTDLGTAAP